MLPNVECTSQMIALNCICICAAECRVEPTDGTDLFYVCIWIEQLAQTHNTLINNRHVNILIGIV